MKRTYHVCVGNVSIRSHTSSAMSHRDAINLAKKINKVFSTLDAFIKVKEGNRVLRVETLQV